jgi:hypothetical protein
LPPLSFTDEEMDSISALASALPQSARDSFLRLVANKPVGTLQSYAAPASCIGLRRKHSAAS